MPRTENSRRRGIRFCGDCGYELARDNDGACPMCRRFEQLRIDFTVPRPSDLAAERAGGALRSTVEEWPPTVADRAVLAERRAASPASLGQHAARVIRTPGLMQTHVPPPPSGATAVGNEDVNSSVVPEPPAQDVAPPTENRGKATAKPKPAGKQAQSRRAARAVSRSSGKARSTIPPATPSSPGPVELNDGPPEPSRTALVAVAPASVATAQIGSEPIAMPTQGRRSLIQAEPVRARSRRSGVVVPLHALTVVAMLVLSAVLGAAVALLMSIP